MGLPIVHFEIGGKDGPALQQFYSTMFDWTIRSMPEMNYGMIDKETTGTIGGGIAQDDDPHTHGTTIYVEVADPQVYLDKAESLGGKTIVPVTEIPEVVTFAIFLDPQGNKVGLVKS